MDTVKLHVSVRRGYTVFMDSGLGYVTTLFLNLRNQNRMDINKFHMIVVLPVKYYLDLQSTQIKLLAQTPFILAERPWLSVLGIEVRSFNCIEGSKAVDLEKVRTVRTNAVHSGKTNMQPKDRLFIDCCPFQTAPFMFHVIFLECRKFRTETASATA